MKLGRAYKIAAIAASHKANAVRYLNSGDTERARTEELQYLNLMEEIASVYRQQVSAFVDAVVALKGDLNRVRS